MKTKRGFTLIELIMVIIIVSILATQIKFNMSSDYDKTDNEYGELYQTLNYVKQLNLNQNFFNGNDSNWTKKTDCFELENSHKYNLNNNGTLLKSQNYDGLKYVVTTDSTITIIGDTTGNNYNKICFDNIGRIYKTNLETKNIIHEKVKIKLKTKNDNYEKIIILEPITGYIK